ncbi:hypothetical protein F0U44_15830 [Nocardioides humilatus]|uniref:MBG domain-containing protein n=1 Tax=Nocardioides humilatus TaxID=2607660 RepID=A0A5B1LDD6_9ACTN|nr:MBG domain-containing protein [Nocardioides humilatus]KAA1417759.1 hypothetical protein F0U44_15830 [Nocardioides humilatus]
MNIRHLIAPITGVLALGGVAALPAPAHATTAVAVRVNGVQTYGGSATFAGTVTKSSVTVSGVTCTGLTGGVPIDATLAAGNYTVDASTCSGGVLSDPDYAIGRYDGMRFIVNPAPLTVTADDKTREFRDPNPPLTYTVTGFRNGDDASVLSGAPRITTNAKAKSQVRYTYKINIAAGSLSAGGNYLLRPFVSGIMTITPKPVIVAVTGAQVYGGAPKYTGTTGWDGIYAGGMTCTKLADGRDIAPTLPVASRLDIDTDTCSGGEVTGGNYEVVGYSSVKFNVLKAPLTLTADRQSRTYGDANPPLTYTVTGFQNGEDDSVLTGAPSITTTADATSTVGNYPIDLEAGTVGAHNYSFTFKDNTLVVRKAPLVLSADAKSRTYGDANPALTYTATGFRNGEDTSVLTGAPSLTTTADATSNVGTYPIDLEAGTVASDNYSFKFNDSTLTVRKALLGLTADAKSRTYGDANPALTYTVAGFRSGDDASVLTGAPSLTTTAATTSNVGTYLIDLEAGSLAAQNYSFAFTDNALTVRKAPLVLTADAKSRSYGAANPALTYTVAGFRNGDDASILIGAPSVTTTAAPASNVGSYPIDLELGSLAAYNYSFTFNDNTLTVTKATLALTADPKSRTYGDANPALTYTVAGFRNGDDASVLTGTPSLTTTAGATSNAGSYPIDLEAGTLAAQNYAFSFTDSALTVNKALLTVAANLATREYSAPDPAYTVTYSGFRNGDTAAVVTGAPGFTTPATVSSYPGNYPLFVNAGTLSSTNYAFGGFAGSILTITQTSGFLETKKMTSAGVLEATLTSGPSRRPVEGATITFYSGNSNSIACTAVTDATGKATCTVTNAGHLNQIERDGYLARYVGNAGVNAIEKRQAA